MQVLGLYSQNFLTDFNQDLLALYVSYLVETESLTSFVNTGQAYSISFY